MKRYLLILVAILNIYQIKAQNDVKIDGRLKPFLDEFFKACEKYDIDYHDKLFKLKNIAIVDTLHTTPEGSTLGMVTRDSNNEIENIIVNWVTLLDKEIVRVVAFHEFAHYFLDYRKHVCDDCGHIMSVVNTSYFDIVKDWNNQLKILFEESPAYKNSRLNAKPETYTAISSLD